jgi:hypothetical protein
VVAERDGVDSHGEELIGQPGRDPDAVGGVLAVHDAGVDRVLALDRLQALLERPATRRPHDVGDEQDAQGAGA